MKDGMLTWSKNNSSLELRPGESDVVIGLSQSQPGEGVAGLWLNGAYQINKSYAKELNVHSLQKAIVIVLTSNGNHKTKNLAGTHMLFDDDEMIKHDMQTGYFNYCLGDWLPSDLSGYVYITASIGKCISNTVQLKQ